MKLGVTSAKQRSIGEDIDILAGAGTVNEVKLPALLKYRSPIPLISTDSACCRVVYSIRL